MPTSDGRNSCKLYRSARFIQVLLEKVGLEGLQNHFDDFARRGLEGAAVDETLEEEEDDKALNQ